MWVLLIFVQRDTHEAVYLIFRHQPHAQARDGADIPGTDPFADRRAGDPGHLCELAHSVSDALWVLGFISISFAHISEFCEVSVLIYLQIKNYRNKFIMNDLRLVVFGDVSQF